MSQDRRFPPEKLAKLDNAERHERMPPSAIVELVAGFEAEPILDIGVGTGYIALPLATRLPAARIIGLDVEPRMLEALADRAEAAHQPGAVEPLLAPHDQIPLPDRTVGVALMVALYHELEDRVAYLQQVQRVLKEGGRLVVCDWDPEAEEGFGPPRDHRIPHSVLTAELTDSGFTNITTHPAYKHLYLVSATRP